MVLKASTLQGRVLRFSTSGAPPDSLQVIRVQGQEAISRPYQFELDLVSPEKDLDGASILHQPAYLAVKQGVNVAEARQRGARTLRYLGIVSSFEKGERWSDWVVYRAILVPRLWRLSTNVRSRIFMDRTVPEIVEEILRESGFAPAEFRFRLSARTYPRREYVVQYQESDLNFISRLLEHEGIFYFFQHEEESEGEKIVFGDSPSAYEAPSPETEIRYREQPGGRAATLVSSLPGAAWFDEESILRLRSRHNSVPQSVLLRDYNYRTPGV